MKYNDFTGMYPVSKTLCFELKPINETSAHVTRILEQDEHRAESYKRVKKLMDEYHKAFIDKVLAKMELPMELLENMQTYYQIKKRTETEKKMLESVQDKLRKYVATCFEKEDSFKRLFAKEFVVEDLPEFVTSELDKAVLAEFKNFTTYFAGFYENRKNMYSDEKKHTAIAYRLIDENLPKFLDNMVAFAKIKDSGALGDKLEDLCRDFSEELVGVSLESLFELNFFNKALTQKQITLYNAVIGGLVRENGKKQGINEYVNLYNQRHRNNKLPKLKVLYKQILSERESLSQSVEAYKIDNDVLGDIYVIYNELSNAVLGERNLKVLLESLVEYDLSGVFIGNDMQISDISMRMFGGWNIIKEAVVKQLEFLNPPKKKDNPETYRKRIENLYKSQKSFSIQELNFCIDRYVRMAVTEEFGRDKKKFYVADVANEEMAGRQSLMHIENYFATLGAVNTETLQRENLFARIANAYTDVKDLLNHPYPSNSNLVNDKKNIVLIKQLLDSMKSLQWFVKPLLGAGLEAERDVRFYGEFQPLWEDLDKVTPLYNKVRNYLTRRPYSEEKFKLNFENSTLMAGWDQNKEKDNSAVILLKDGLYYLGIMNAKYSKAFDGTVPHEGECYQKMVYKLLPGANKMLPKVFFSKGRIAEFNPSKEIMEIKEQGRYKGEHFNLRDCHKLIDFYKQSIAKHPDWKKFDFQFSETEIYENINQFFDEIEQQGYKISYQSVSVSYIEQLVKDGKLYLFQIYNKDFSPYSKGVPNMHTLYWKMLFDEENLKNVVYKLSGEAEVFYRKKSISYSHPTHPANCPIANKNRENKKKESVFKYDLIKDKRYTVDKFMLHVPIVANFKSRGGDDINQQVRAYLQTAPDTHVIGIDRGERNLLYLVVVDSRGKIVKQINLNKIESQSKGREFSYVSDYHRLLDDREQEIREARKSWQTIEKIKNLKEGYLAQVVHQIAQLMIEYKAIVVLEDLNFGFKRSRQKVEKQVYQKFEQMLIDKLNYLVDKRAVPTEMGGLLHAYQLTSKFTSFERLGKQSGFLFYVPAWNTSKIDPVTGFVNLFDTRYKNIAEAKSFFGKFDSIRYNASDERFEFKFDYNNFTDKAAGTRTKWTLCADGKTRLQNWRNPAANHQWQSRKVRPVEELKDLFFSYGIDIHGNLKESISNQDRADFFERLLAILRVILQMRNSEVGTSTDYLLSPVCDENGVFFESNEMDERLPQNADANGAYNIARKGLMLLQQLRESGTDIKKPTYDLSNKAWLHFVQNSK